MVPVYFFPKLNDQVASDSKNTHTGNVTCFFLDEKLATVLKKKNESEFNGQE